MEARKNLKWLSVLVLALAAFTFVRVIVQTFCVEFNAVTLPEGATEGVILAAQIILCVVSLILLLPQIYVGVKGVKVAKTPDRSKAHIVWAMILAVIGILGLISPISNMIEAKNILDNLFTLLDLASDVLVYIAYVVYAKQVLKAA